MSLLSDIGSGSGSGSGRYTNVSNDSCRFDLKTSTPLAAIVFHAIILSIIIVLSITSNSLILILVAKYRALRTQDVILSLTIPVADLVLTLFYTCPALITTVMRRWIFGRIGCIIFGFLASDIFITRWILISLLCVDRFWIALYPFSYRKKAKFILPTLGVLAWVLPVIFSLLPLIHRFAEYELRENVPTCLPVCSNKDTMRICQVYYFIVLFSTFIIGSVIPTVLYSWMYHKGKKIHRSIRDTISRISMGVAGGSLLTQSMAEQSIREKTATVTFTLIFITVVVTALPSFILQFLRAISSDVHCLIPIYIHFFIFQVLISASFLTPLLILRNRDFYICLQHLFSCGNQTADFMPDGPDDSRPRNPSLPGHRTTSFNQGASEPNKPDVLDDPVVPNPSNDITDSSQPSTPVLTGDQITIHTLEDPTAELEASQSSCAPDYSSSSDNENLDDETSPETSPVNSPANETSPTDNEIPPTNKTSPDGTSPTNESSPDNEIFANNEKSEDKISDDEASDNEISTSVSCTEV